MDKMNTRNNAEQNLSYSVAPKPIQYSYFCRFDEPESILVCPEKRMLKLSDLEEVEGEDSFEEWIKGRKIEH